MTKRRIIKRRARIFLGCEGESEQAYGAFLQRLADENSLSVHILPVNLQPAGSTLALAKKAVKMYAKEKVKGGFAGKAILLDSDLLETAPDQGRCAKILLENEGFTTIWQQPDHEGLLLRHFAGHDYDDPPRGSSMAALRVVWPGYSKNMSAIEIQQTLSVDDVQCAAGVIAELQTLLDLIGIV